MTHSGGCVFDTPSTPNGLVTNPLWGFYGAAGALPGRKPATGRFHLIVRVRWGAKNKTHPDGWVLFFGDPERTRTVDLQRDRLAC